MDSTTEVVGEVVAGWRLELLEPVDSVEVETGLLQDLQTRLTGRPIRAEEEAVKEQLMQPSEEKRVDPVYVL